MSRMVNLKKKWINMNIIKFIKDHFKAIIGLVFVLVFAVTVFLVIPKTPVSIVENPLIEKLQQQYKKDIKELREDVDSYKEQVNSKLYNDSILFVNKTKEINELKLQLKNIKIENEKKHIINSNTTTDEAVLILRNNIKARTGKK